MAGLVHEALVYLFITGCFYSALFDQASRPFPLNRADWGRFLNGFLFTLQSKWRVCRWWGIITRSAVSCVLIGCGETHEYMWWKDWRFLGCSFPLCGCSPTVMYKVSLDVVLMWRAFDCVIVFFPIFLHFKLLSDYSSSYCGLFLLQTLYEIPLRISGWQGFFMYFTCPSRSPLHLLAIWKPMSCFTTWQEKVCQPSTSFQGKPVCTSLVWWLYKSYWPTSQTTP